MEIKVIDGISMLDDYGLANIIPIDFRVVMRGDIMEGCENLIGNYSFEIFCKDLGQDILLKRKTKCILRVYYCRI